MARAQVIVVLGVTGVGKSTFIQYATGLVVQVGHGQEACTSQPKLYQMPGTDVYFLDTPGFDDTYVSDATVLRNITEALIDSFNDQADIKGALYVHAVTEPRMRGSGKKNLRMFEKMLGTEAMSKCRLVTTKWSNQAEEISRGRVQELCEKPEFWQPLVANGAQTVRFGDSMQSAINIIRPLIQGPAFQPLVVKEVVQDKKRMPQTSAGIQVNDDIGEARAAHKAEIAEIKAEEKKTTGALRDELRAEREEHEAKVRKLAEDQRLLEQSLSTGSSGRFGRWVARGCAVVAGGLMTIASGGFLAPAAALLYGATETGAQIHKATSN